MPCIPFKKFNPRAVLNYGTNGRSQDLAVFVGGVLQKAPSDFKIPECYLPDDLGFPPRFLDCQNTPIAWGANIASCQNLQDAINSINLPAPGNNLPLSDRVPSDGGATPGISNFYAREDHRHPVGLLAFPTFTQNFSFVGLNFAGLVLWQQRATEDQYITQVELRVVSTTTSSAFIFPFAAPPGWEYQITLLNGVRDIAAPAANRGMHPAWVNNNAVEILPRAVNIVLQVSLTIFYRKV